MNWAKLSGMLTQIVGYSTIVAAFVCGLTKGTWFVWLAIPWLVTAVLAVMTYRLPEGKPDALAAAKTPRWRYIFP